jgi:hypothetical protein
VYVPVWRRIVMGEKEDKKVQWWDSPPVCKADPGQALRVHEPPVIRKQGPESAREVKRHRDMYPAGNSRRPRRTCLVRAYQARSSR